MDDPRLDNDDAGRAYGMPGQVQPVVGPCPFCGAVAHHHQHGAVLMTHDSDCVFGVGTERTASFSDMTERDLRRWNRRANNCD